MRSTNSSTEAVRSGGPSDSQPEGSRYSPLTVELPTIDIVVAYYNEPVKGLRRTISRLRSELTWAQVNVVVYHSGIPGFDQGNFTEKDVEEAAERLRMDIGADLVVPRKNVGREMVTYLQHM